MATKKTVTTCLASLISTFCGDGLSKASMQLQIEAWHSALADLPDEDVARATERALRECRAMPVPADVRKFAAEVAAERERANITPPDDPTRALREAVRYMPPARWQRLRERDVHGRIRRAVARAWLAVVPAFDRKDDERRYRAQKADLADRLVDALELAGDEPERVCPGGDLWDVVRQPDEWRDETQRRWRTAEELRRLAVDPCRYFDGQLVEPVRAMAGGTIRRHAEAGAIADYEADMLLGELRDHVGAAARTGSPQSHPFRGANQSTVYFRAGATQTADSLLSGIGHRP